MPKLMDRWNLSINNKNFLEYIIGMIGIQYAFGSLVFAEQYIIGEMNEGVDVQIDTVSEIIEIAERYFAGKPWAYISNRINSYSIQPIVHLQAPKINPGFNLLAYAIVANEDSIKSHSWPIEQRLVSGRYHFSYFSHLCDAIDWVESIVTDERD